MHGEEVQKNMTVNELKMLLDRFDDCTEVVITGSWQYSKVVVGSIKKFEGLLSIVIDAVEMDERVELYASLEEVQSFRRCRK